MGLVVYADFTSPYCHLASRRVDALRAAGVGVDSRAVEARPRLPVGGLRDATELRELARKCDEVGGLLVAGEEFPGVVPEFVANTQAAVSAYAESYGAGVADDVRRLLFRLYWEDGVDIGNPNSLRTPLAGPILRGHSSAEPPRESGYAVSVARGPITTGAWRRIRAWHADWLRLGSRELPALLDDSGLTLTGELALRRLAKEIAYVDAPLQPRLPDPARYPEQAVHPPVGWATQTGGHWRYVGRPAVVR
jgi:hypothetical protein